jgi:glycosyltransferase involved in cell wall biosynthesis
MPVSLLEAFSAGLLVITSNVGGVPYMVEHGRTGLLFESDNDSDMADQMLWALSHQSESLQIIKNAKEEVKQYSWEVVGQQIKSLYE